MEEMTDEDAVVWLRVRADLQEPDHINYVRRALQADRRDALVMSAIALATACGVRMWWIGRQYLFLLGEGPPPPRGRVCDPPP
jgi:hypothetical protein